MKYLLMGYSGRGTLLDTFVFITSYNLSVNNNVIKSTAIQPIYDRTSSAWSRFSPYNAIRDAPVYDIALSCQITSASYSSVMNELKNNTFHKAINVQFSDPQYGLTYKFSKCFLKSVNFNVANNAVATMDFSFGYFSSSFEMSYLTSDAKASYDTPEESGQCLMPYWEWNCQYNLMKTYKNKPYAFSFTYNQTVTPKYVCSHSTAVKSPPIPLKVVFGVPQMKFNVTYVMDNISVDEFSVNANKIATNANDYVEFGCSGINYKLTNCHPDNYSLQIANAGSVNFVTIDCTVYGSLEKK